MRSKRNRTLDVFRTVAILSVLIYHFYVLADDPYQGNQILNRFLGIGGELGVTLFFIISGFGIFSSLSKMESEQERIGVSEFLKKRFFRILPQYYACLAILLLITSSAQYVNKKGMFDVITHLFFIHNWFPSTHGSINGVLWSMGTIFQFYFIAVFIYRAVRKNKWLTCVLSIVVSVGAKFVIFHWILPNTQAEPSWYFVYARQIITALDNFVFGMILCCILKRLHQKGRKAFWGIGAALSFGACCWWIWEVEKYSPYSDTVFGYVWHTVFAALLTIFILCVCGLGFRFKSPVSRIVLWISKYQYGIYIWHFLIASTLLSYSTAVQAIARNSFVIFTVLMCVICCVAGYASTVVFESISYKEQWNKLKEELLGIGENSRGR